MSKMPRMYYDIFEHGMEVVIQGNGYYRVQTYNQYFNLTHILAKIFNTTPNKAYEEFQKIGFRAMFQQSYDYLYCETLEEALRVKAWFDSVEVMNRLKEAK